MIDQFKIFRNAEPLQLATVPNVPVDTLSDRTRDAVATGARLVAWFGQKLPDRGQVRIYSVVADDPGHRLGVMIAEVPADSSYGSLTADIPAADRAERELFEQCGIRPEGHPWLKPVRHPVPAAKLEPGRVLGSVPENNIGRDYPFWSLAGDAVHEVGVGPIHAGVIGPGYFRFSCVGERIEHLEIMLGFEHRGAEEMILAAEPARLPVLVESIAGDASAAYATAHSQAMEALYGIEVTDHDEALRAFAVENERLAYHVGDLGALAGDVAYWPSAAYFGRLRGEFLNTAMDLGGNRQGRYLVRPGGIRRPLKPATKTRLVERFRSATVQITDCLEQMFSSLSVLSRFEGSACVSRDNAVAFGFVGPVARASGVAVDVRTDHPVGYWQRHDIEIALGVEGSVLDRATIRKKEIERSLALCGRILDSLPDDHEVRYKPARLTGTMRGDLCISLVESWRGQVMLAYVYDGNGRLTRFKSQDPSFQNWNAMQLANRGNAISDFPVCNKSCNLAYNGHDL
jgi:Ni,Fe-hydrogenase III large subunit